MRILFQMPFPGYLRMYGSTVRALADRGHQVLVSYDKPAKRRDPAAAAVEAHERIELVRPIPGASRRFERAIGQMRLAMDYLRYLDRRFADSQYLRRRLEGHLRGPLRLLTRAPYGLPGAALAGRALLAVERRVPSDGRVERALAAHAPDAIVVTPLLGRSDRNRRQTDTVKAARRLGIPVAAGVATWDHLTTKGVIKALPDRLFVWNEIQLADAVELHRVPPERVVVTGAQLFDGWFERAASAAREDFLAAVGLDAARFVLYVGSSPNIAPPELEIPFVRRWIEALRGSGDPQLEEIGVLIRPHPYNVDAWAAAELEVPGALVAPRTPPALPMTEQDEAFYFDSMRFSEAVVGINTTAMVESFVVRRPVLTIRSPEFRETQQGTLHFGELVSASGGALQVAGTLDEHVGQLRSTLEHPEGLQAEIDRFLLTFVRPRGLDRSATAILADAIEDLAGGGRVAASPSTPLAAAL
jgi:hypothetical protein